MKLVVLLSVSSLFAQTYTSWADYSGASDSSQYSALDQINRSNVAKLELAWTYQTGDNNKYFFNPLVVDKVAYVLAKNNSIVALDASTGKEIWTHPSGPEIKIITNRGINYWESKDRSDRRLLFASNHFLRAIDARTGKIIPTFGTDGAVDLKQGLGRDPKTLSLVQSMTPGRVFEDLLILGSATNQGYGSAPGDLRAFDVRTGKRVWSFHTIPQSGEFGNDTWGKDSWKYMGNMAAWGPLTADESLRYVYVPLSAPTFSYYGVHRPGKNVYSDSLVALNIKTGKLMWNFQNGAPRYVGL